MARPTIYEVLNGTKNGTKRERASLQALAAEPRKRPTIQDVLGDNELPSVDDGIEVIQNNLSRPIRAGIQPQRQGFSVMRNIIRPAEQGLLRLSHGINEILFGPTHEQFREQLQQDPTAPERFRQAAAPAETIPERTAEIIGQIAGLTVPVGGAFATGGRLAQRGFQTATRGIQPTTRTGRTAMRTGEIAARGAGAGTAFGAFGELQESIAGEQQPLAGRLGDIAKESALFAGGDVALFGAGQALRPALRRLRESQPVQRLESRLRRDRVVEQNPAIQSARAKIVTEPRSRGFGFSNLYNTLRRQFIDDLEPVERAERTILGDLPQADESLYKQARLFRGTPAKAQNIVETRLQPIIRQVEDAGYSYEDLGLYALMRHAKDVNEAGLTSGFTKEEIDAVLNEFGTPVMEKARKQLMELNTKLLQSLADAGVISKESVKVMRKKWPNYMPLFRDMGDDVEQFTSQLSGAVVNPTSPIKRLKGSERDVVDPIQSVVKNIFTMTRAAERNKVAQMLKPLASRDIDAQFIRRLEPGESTVGKNIVHMLEDGKKVQFEVHPELYRALTNLDRESGKLLIRALEEPAAWLRAGATLAPEFSVRNIFRDIPHAYIVSESGYRLVRDTLTGLAQAAKKGDLYRQFIDDMGGYGNLVSGDRNLHREALRSVLSQSPGRRMVNIVNPLAWKRVLQYISETAEQGIKLGEYQAALRKGVSRQEAAYRARDIMDFARAGTVGRQVNRIVPFFNASLQGKSKMFRAFQNDPIGVTTRALKVVTLPTIGAFLAQKYLANEEQKKIIDDAPDWMKETFWLIPIPGTDIVARIPKPHDFAAVFANPMEKFLNYAWDHEKDAFDDFFRDTLASQSISVMIAGITPLFEGAANFSFFRQAPIIPQREQNLEFPDQADVNTSETAKVIAQLIDNLTGGEGAFRRFGSPRVVEHVIRGLTSTLGTYATDAVDVVLHGLGVGDDVQPPARRITDMPFVRSFTVDPLTTGESVNELYRERDRLRRAKGSAELRREPFREQARLNAVEQATKQIGDISRRIREIQNHPTMTPERKREMIERLVNQRNEIARRTMQRLQ